jgi:hypothetical protein
MNTYAHGGPESDSWMRLGRDVAHEVHRGWVANRIECRLRNLVPEEGQQSVVRANGAGYYIKADQMLGIAHVEFGRPEPYDWSQVFNIDVYGFLDEPTPAIVASLRAIDEGGVVQDHLDYDSTLRHGNTLGLHKIFGELRYLGRLATLLPA